MATADGYAPYPINLTALQVKNAVTRAHNLSTEFLGYVGYKFADAAPSIAVDNVKDGDIWRDSNAVGSGSNYYRADIDNITTPASPVLVYFEV